MSAAINLQEQNDLKEITDSEIEYILYFLAGPSSPLETTYRREALEPGKYNTAKIILITEKCKRLIRYGFLSKELQLKITEPQNLKFTKEALEFIKNIAEGIRV